MVRFVPKSCLFDFFLLTFFLSYREIDTVQCKNPVIVTEKYVWGDLQGVWANYLMLACYYPQGKQQFKSCLFDFFLLRFFQSYREIDTVQCKKKTVFVTEKYVWGDLRGVWAPYLMLALRWNALRQRMAEEESGAWGCVDNGDVIVRLTGQQTNHATSKLFTLWVVAC